MHPVVDPIVDAIGMQPQYEIHVLANGFSVPADLEKKILPEYAEGPGYDHQAVVGSPYDPPGHETT